MRHFYSIYTPISSPFSQKGFLPFLIRYSSTQHSDVVLKELATNLWRVLYTSHHLMIGHGTVAFKTCSLGADRRREHHFLAHIVCPTAWKSLILPGSPSCTFHQLNCIKTALVIALQYQSPRLSLSFLI